VQAGVLNFSVGARPFATIPKPFQMRRLRARRSICPTATLNQISAAPNPAVGATGVSGTALGHPDEDAFQRLLRGSNILIEAEQQFNVKIAFPSATCLILATNVVDDTTNPVKIGVILDGLLLRLWQ